MVRPAGNKCFDFKIFNVGCLSLLRVSICAFVIEFPCSNLLVTLGTLVVDGVKAGVGASGIIRTAAGTTSGTGGLPTTKKLLMRDRLVVLCKLGHGASSAVYKALDLMDMRLVALKMIHVNEKYVLEL
jgi:hypothetical protein